MGHVQRKLCLLASLGAAPLGAQAGRPAVLQFFGAQRTAQNGALVDVDTGRIRVPENRSRPGSKQISLFVLRFRARHPSAASPIIYISGGSGAGTVAALGPRVSLFLALADSADVIAFDLRGSTGASLPALSCPTSDPIPLGDALQYEALVQILTARARLCAAALRQSGVDISGYNIPSMSEDIESIRLALGVSRVRLWGISTGTHIAQEYIRRHSARVESAVLAGVEGPGQTSDYPSDQDSTLVELARRAGSPVLTPGLLDSLTTHPVKAEVTANGVTRPVTVGRLEAQLYASAMLGDRRQMATLPTVFDALRRGDALPMSGFMLQMSVQPFQSAMEAIADCQSPPSSERIRTRRVEAGRTLIGWGTLDFPEACVGWGLPPSKALPPVRASTPILFIAGTLDGRTSVRNAREVMRGFPNARLLLLDGASHGDDLFLASPLIAERICLFFATARARNETITIQ